MLARLDALGLSASTLVIFMSDNGMNCGHHGIWGKGNGTRPQNMYDTSVKVPCLFAQPGRIAPAARDDLLSGYDVFPTLLDYLGIADRGRESAARSQFPPAARRQRPVPGAHEIVVYDEYGPVRMVRTRDWKYVHRYPAGPHELFDLRNDPESATTSSTKRARVSSRTSCADRLESWFRQYVDPQRDGVDMGVTGCGQVARVDRPAAGAAFADGHTESTDWDLWLEKKHV